eukprot:TRINITY_DN6681_c0_g1_i1.p1 TRINITY_DN6681_c0_g1~~TRINITY_DN6681_c0_g1_i1.p1  ORF type:complete len:479 (-),score=107.94 TRINITY_DN6681_c0_g1_i1:527-1963(-)
MAGLPDVHPKLRRRQASTGVVLVGALVSLRVLYSSPGSARLAWSRAPAFGGNPRQWHPRHSSKVVRRCGPFVDDNEAEGYRSSATDAEEAEEDSSSAQAWREFRARLIQSERKKEVTAESLAEERRAVAPQNEKMLKNQNEKLWIEYVSGAWAHVGLVEPGALLCAMPLEAQLHQLMRTDENSFWGQQLRKRLEEQLPIQEANRSKDELFDTWQKNTHYVYRLAESLIAESLSTISEKAENGQLDLGLLTPAQREIVQRYVRSQERWQQVCLVLDAASPNMAKEAVVINRPLSAQINKKLANVLLNGSPSASGLKNYDDRMVSRCAQAFGDESAVYLGGKEDQDQPGLLVHGISDLPGAKEISPGTGIYTGGVEAAIEGVLNGKYQPLDFRWFVGRTNHVRTATGEWRAVACARPLALKQCLGLPKPLWHEVLELCGGESSALSQLELQLRTDLQKAEGKPAEGKPGDAASGAAPAKK